VRQTPRMALCAAMAVLALTTACGGTTGSGGAGASGGGSCAVQIGFFGALTGDYANLGQNIKNSVKLAVDEHNAAKPKCTVTLAEYDSQAEPSQAPALAKKAIDTKNLLGLVGPAFSGESKAAGPLLDEAGLPWITTATNPALADRGWGTFHRILGNDATQGPAAVSYLRGTAGASKVFVVDDASEYGKGLAGIVRAGLGKQVVGTDTIQAKQVDFGPTVTKIRSSGADAVYFGGYYAEAGLLLKQLRTGGSKAVFVSDDGAKDDGFVVAAGAKAAEGAVLTCPCLPAERAVAFAASYQKAFSVPPGTYSAECYDAAKALLAGIDAGNTTRGALNTFLGSYRAQGVSKAVGWDAKGEPTSGVVWAYRVKGGKIVADRQITQ
jgi:branched-chain amino acid transport system substrate-binding protein